MINFRTLALLNALSAANDDRGSVGLPGIVQQFTGRPEIGIPCLIPNFCWLSSRIFFDLLLEAAIKMMTARKMVPQIAALAAIVILSMLEETDDTVLTSRH